MKKCLCILVPLLLTTSGCLGIFGGNDRDDEPGTCVGDACNPDGIFTGRVDLQGLSVQLTDKYDCMIDGEMIACGSYVIRFTIENGTDLNGREVNQIELASPTTVIARTPFSTCHGAAPLAHQRSDVQQVDLVWASGAASEFCHRGFNLEPALPAPYAGEVMVTVRGILEDASTFEATASANIQDIAP